MVSSLTRKYSNEAYSMSTTTISHIFLLSGCPAIPAGSIKKRPAWRTVLHAGRGDYAYNDKRYPQWR